MCTHNIYHKAKPCCFVQLQVEVNHKKKKEKKEKWKHTLLNLTQPHYFVHLSNISFQNHLHNMGPATSPQSYYRGYTNHFV